MIVNIETQFNTDFETVVNHLHLSKTLAHINYPLISFEPTNKPFPEVWEPGEYEANMKVFSSIPSGKQTIGIEKIEGISDKEYIIRDNGYGDLINKWDHWIYLKKTEDKNKVIYIDRVDVKAGILTPFVWLFSSILYRWRQYRWKQLIKNNFEQIK